MRHLALGAAAAAALACGDAPAPARSGPSAAAAPAADAPAAAEPAAVTLAAREPLAAGTDVVLITIDTLRFDALGFAGQGFAGGAATATPNLDRLARTGRVFTSAYAHNVVTLPSHANILTGLYPYQHGVRENSGFKLGPDVPTLAVLLKAQGYTTAAFVAAFPLDARYGLGRGFDVYDDNYPSGSHADQFLAAARRGDKVVAPAVEWWGSAAGGPRFLWVHLYDPHAPYAAPEPFASRYPERPYLAEVAATDAFLEPLLDLVTAGEAPLVVMTSDHGEALGDHGELTHGLFCYQATLKVPLVVWGPGIEPGVDDRLAGHVDIVPTVLTALGLPLPDEVAGHSLLAPATERKVYFEALTSFLNRGWAPLRGLIEGSHKMIEVPLPEIYDLAEDPREQSNLFATERGRFQKLRSALPRSEKWPPEPRQVSAEEEAKLRSLGYVAGSARGTSLRPEDDPKRLVGLDQKIQHTIIAYSEGRLEAAAGLAREVIGERPDMSLGYVYMALALRQLERPGEAIAALRAALERGLTDASVLRQLGLTYAENGLAREAIEVLQPLAGDDDPTTLAALGIALSDAGRHQEALAVLERSLGLDDNEPKTLETLGVVTLRTQRPAAAKRWLERALELNDNLPFSWNTLGVVHAYQGETAAAMDAWDKAVELDPRQYDALYNLGMTAARLGETGRARRALERYVASAPPERFAPDIEKARRTLRGLP